MIPTDKSYAASDDKSLLVIKSASCALDIDPAVPTCFPLVVEMFQKQYVGKEEEDHTGLGRAVTLLEVISCPP